MSGETLGWRGCSGEPGPGNSGCRPRPSCGGGESAKQGVLTGRKTLMPVALMSKCITRELLKMQIQIQWLRGRESESAVGKSPG